MFKYLLILLVSFNFLSTSNGFEELTKQAKSENKNIVIYFSGSDWCTICMKFKKKVLQEKEIRSLLDDNYVYYVADFPQLTQLKEAVVKKNEALAEKLNQEGFFPFLVITDENLTVKKKFTSQVSTKELTQALKLYTK